MAQPERRQPARPLLQTQPPPPSPLRAPAQSPPTAVQVPAIAIQLRPRSSCPRPPPPGYRPPPPRPPPTTAQAPDLGPPLALPLKGQQFVSGLRSVLAEAQKERFRSLSPRPSYSDSQEIKAMKKHRVQVVDTAGRRGWRLPGPVSGPVNSVTLSRSSLRPSFERPPCKP